VEASLPIAVLRHPAEAQSLLGKIPALCRRLLIAALLHRHVEQIAAAVSIDVAAPATDGVIVIALAERIKDFVQDQPVPRVSLALIRALATLLAETCAIADADATEANRFIHSHVEMLRTNAAEQYERLLAIQRAASTPPQGHA